jgi:hypothetical protein
MRIWNAMDTHLARNASRKGALDMQWMQWLHTWDVLRTQQLPNDCKFWRICAHTALFALQLLCMME